MNTVLRSRPVLVVAVASICKKRTRAMKFPSASVIVLLLLASGALPAALSPKAQSFVDSVDKDPSGFFFSVSYLEHDGRTLGIVYAVNAVNAAQIRETEARIIDIDKKEAMAITGSLAASGMFDKTSVVPPGVTPRGWNVFLGTGNAEAFWHLGKNRDALFKSPNIMKVREVLSAKSREAWDDFMRRAGKRHADLLEDIQSGDAGTRGKAALQFADSASPDQIRKLIHILQTAEDNDVRASCADALGHARARDAVPAFVAALDVPDWRVKRSTVNALARIGDPRAVDPLIVPGAWITLFGRSRKVGSERHPQGIAY